MHGFSNHSYNTGNIFEFSTLINPSRWPELYVCTNTRPLACYYPHIFLSLVRNNPFMRHILIKFQMPYNMDIYNRYQVSGTHYIQVKWIHNDTNSFSRDYNYMHIC